MRWHVYVKQRWYNWVFSSSYPMTSIGVDTSERALAFLQNHGFKIKKGKLYGKWDHYRSGNIKERAAEFNDLLYEPDVECLIEDTGKFAAHAERYYSMLKICGVFDKVSGIILGKHRKFDDQWTGKNHTDILLEVLDGQDIPILADIDCCHTIPMMTLPIGGTIHLDADKQEISIIKF